MAIMISEIADVIEICTTAYTVYKHRKQIVKTGRRVSTSLLSTFGGDYALPTASGVIVPNVFVAPIFRYPIVTPVKLPKIKIKIQYPGI